ncbi:uncharacterized protein [uncultured Mediterranean phage uvMED]|nr:uncharacterized protein [uncultured Mediterranean phage uvMED]
MALDHQAIRKAYPSVVLIDDDGSKILDASGNAVSVEQSNIDAARVTLDAEAAAVKYKTDRTTDGSTTYDTIGNQLGMLYDDIIAGKVDATGSFAIHNKAVKDANPKPS